MKNLQKVWVHSHGINPNIRFHEQFANKTRKMSERIDPDFKEEMKAYGTSSSWNACFHCGNCTALCPLTENEALFPRKGIRQMQLGLKESLASNVDPWLCYYCGECSDTCPRNANPGEIMMALRRYLTTIYDWTGLARRFYNSKKWEFGMLGLVASLILILFIFFHGPMTTELTPQGGVQLNSFAPWKSIEIGDWILAGLLSFFLLSNIFNMYFKIVLKDRSLRVPPGMYITELWALIVHFFTQKKFATCEKGRSFWISHLLLMTGYSIMFLFIVVLLRWFQTDTIHPWWHGQRLLGYYATLGMLVGIIYFLIGRIRKDKQKNKYSHFTDWSYLILLLAGTLTGILVHIFRISGLPMITYYTYVIHLMILVPMLVIEVPFSKWSHLAYRPFAIYFYNLKKRAQSRQLQPA